MTTFTGDSASSVPWAAANGTDYGAVADADHHHHHHQDEEAEEEAEEEPKVSSLELFSDLVIVVSIHVVAEPLEEDGFDNYALYFARVFYLWFVWHMATLFMNTAVKMKSQNCPVHNFVMFFWMAVVLQMTQNFTTNDDMKAILWYLLLRLVESLVFTKQIFLPYKAKEDCHGSKCCTVSDEWLQHMQAFIPVTWIAFVLCELLPLSMAIFLGSREDGPYFPAILVSILLIVVGFFFSAIDRSGFSNDHDGTRPTATTTSKKMIESAFDADHLQERYELITLIFTGELCFAAGKHGNEVASTAVLFMAFATYLLTFKTHPLVGHTKFWIRGVVHTVAGLFLYAGVFCAIPAMGSAFVRIVESGQEEEYEEEQEGGEDASVGISAGDLLCYSAGAFMIFTASINLIHVDPVVDAPKIGAGGRGAIRIATGLLILSLSVLVPESMLFGGVPVATSLVPLLSLSCAAVEIWAVGSLKLAC
jgi:low temperature requirement protein LtrA